MKYCCILVCCLLVWTGPAGWSAPAAPKATVTLQLKETPMHQALGILFDQWGVSYSIASDVPNVPITMAVQEMPFPTALRAMLRLGSTSTHIQGAGVVRRDITYQKTTSPRGSDMYEVVLRRDSSPPEQAVGPETVNIVQPAMVEKFPIQYLRPQEVVDLLTRHPPPPGTHSLQPLSRDNSLLVRGDPDAIQNIKTLIRLMDVPPRPLQVSVGISGPGLNGTALALRSMARALVGDDVTIDEQAVIGGQPAHLKVTLRTQLLGNGDLQVASDWDVSVPIAGGPRGPVRLVKRLSTTTQLQPREQSSIAEVDLAGWGGKGVLRLWVRGEWGGGGAAARK